MPQAGSMRRVLRGQRLLGAAALLLLLLAQTGRAFLPPSLTSSMLAVPTRGFQATARATPAASPRTAPLRSGAEDDNDGGSSGSSGGGVKKRRRKVPLPAELLEAQQEGAAAAEAPSSAMASSAAPAAAPTKKAAPPAKTREQELEERLRQDIARFKAVEKASKDGEGEGGAGADSGLAALGGKAASALEKVLVADFFVVLGFLGWFLAGVLFKSAFDDRSVLDAFNSIWTPVIQPALGILMAGTLGVGAINQLSKGKEEQR